MVASLSAVEKLWRMHHVFQNILVRICLHHRQMNRVEAPITPRHPSQDVPASPVEASPSRPVPGPETNRPQKVEEDFNVTPTRVAVSYKTEAKKEPQKEVTKPEPVMETEAVEVISETPSRSRRETVKPVKKKNHI